MLLGAGALAGAGLGGASLGNRTSAWAESSPFVPEKGARLKLLRWQRFVKSEDDAFRRLVAAFTVATGVPVDIGSAPNLETSLKAQMIADIGAGADLVWSNQADAHLYPDKLVDLSDVAGHLEGKLGGWYEIAHEYGTHNGRWICLPVALTGNAMTYRISWLRAAGFDSFPTNLQDFLLLAQALKRIGHPMGLSLGPSITDGNCWTHWLLWQFGAAVFDEANRPTIRSPETLAALEYARELYPNFIDGTLTWIDTSNNNAFLSGAIACTNNPISTYAELVAMRHPMADDTDHAVFPLGPLGKPAELNVMRPLMLFRHTRFPNAAKAFMTFLMERAHYGDYLESAVGYLSQTLKGYEALPMWTEDPKRLVFRDAAARSRSFAYKGKLGYPAAAILSDQIVLQMFAEAASRQTTPEQAIIRADQRIAQYLAT